MVLVDVDIQDLNNRIFELGFKVNFNEIEEEKEILINDYDRIVLPQLIDIKERIEKLAEKNGLRIKILPRIGMSKQKKSAPDKILAYQLMGSEENGIGGSLLGKVNQTAQIPIQGSLGSLNVSVAAGVAVFEVVRQRL